MDEALLRAYRRSSYRVRLHRGGAAVIHVGQPLPRQLEPLAGNRDWGFLTAWNPRSQPQSVDDNRKAQRRLLADLHANASWAIHPALGMGSDGWREPSLWIVGIPQTSLERLAARYDQNAWLYGHGAGIAQLGLR